MSAWTDLGGRRRTLARQVYQRDRTTPGYVCPKCRQPIDWTLPYRDEHGRVDVWCKTVDHVHERQDGGDLTHLDNLMTVHLKCNASKGAARRHERERVVRQASATIALDPRTI